MAARVRSTPSLLWLSAAFVPSFSDQQDDNSLWALLPRWHLSWQTCFPWLASHLRCLSLVRRTSWFNNVLAGLSVHLWAFTLYRDDEAEGYVQSYSFLCTPLRSCIRQGHFKKHILEHIRYCSKVYWRLEEPSGESTSRNKRCPKSPLPYSPTFPTAQVSFSVPLPESWGHGDVQCVTSFSLQKSWL